MSNQICWPKIKQSLKDNFVSFDFDKYASTAFVGVDFDHALEIFRYLLELKVQNHDETKILFTKLEQYADSQLNKDVLKELVFSYEPFLKKLFERISSSNLSSNLTKAPALGWCYNQIFDKLSIPQNPDRTRFFQTNLVGKIEEPAYSSSEFIGFLTDSTEFGKALHSSYHLRNLNIHNDSPLNTRDIADYITDYLSSYIYFVFKYYCELSAVIPTPDLKPPHSVVLKNLASLSGGAYSPKIENEVKRENIIQTIESKLGELDVLFLEGEDGIGKTTILHQIIAKYPDNCFAYFIDSRDSITYSNLAILKAFCNQIHFVNRGAELEEHVNVYNYSNEDWLEDYLSTEKLKSKANHVFYFIVDGLDEITHDKQLEIKEHILDKLPYNKPNFKLILTGKQTKNLLKTGVRHDKYDISYLSEDESFKVLGKTISKEQFADFNKVCKNNAGKIVFFRDLIKKIGIETLSNKLSSDLKCLYENLWNGVNEINENHRIILAVIAFEDVKYDSSKIGKILDRTERQVINLLQDIPFVKKNARGTYEYIFDGFIDFAKLKLSSYKSKIDKIVIDYLLGTLDSVESLIRLPELYRKTGRKDDLLKLLTNERWNQLLVSSEKISVVSRVSNVALETIQDENENKFIPTILKYSVLQSALKELSRTTVWQYEISASLLLEDYMGAENLANLAFLKEDRLKMFGSIAKAYVEKKQKVPSHIIKKIESLYEDIDCSKDFKNIKESSVEIASLLMYSCPKLAFRLIEDLSGGIVGNDNAFDWALAQMSLSVQSNLEKLEDVSKEDINSKVYSKIRNPKIKELADAIFFLSENLTSDQVIEKIKQLESTSQKMFLIRNWISNNKKNDKISDVIDLGLELVVDKSDKYVPKSGDYKVFALPLPYLADKQTVYKLIKRIEQYTASIEANSATIDLLSINLSVARSMCNFEFDKGEEKLLDIYSEIENLTDLALKCTCLAIFSNEVALIEDKLNGKALDLYLNSARESINNYIDTVLEQTAAHFEIVQSIITYLVRLFPGDALKICKKLNKSIDRDNAYLESLTAYLKQNICNIDIATVDDFLINIADLDIKEMAISEIIKRIEGIESTAVNISSFSKYLEMVDDLFDNRAKCLLYVKAISILEKNGLSNSIVCEKLRKTWNEFEKSVHKIELGYEIAYHAAFLKDKTLSNDFLILSKREKEKPDLLLDSPNTIAVYDLVIQMTLRLFAGLVIKKEFTSGDLDNIDRLINSLPSERQQITLWGTLILRIVPKSPQDDPLVKRLINSYIIPKLSKIGDKNERINTIVDVIVVLYLNDNNLQNLDELPSPKLKDIALSKICKFLFTQCLPDEICDTHEDGYKIDYQGLKKVIELTNRMSNDYFIASQVIEVRKSILSRNTIISTQQRVDIKNEFEKMANLKLPDPNNIRHNGYRILVNANAIAVQGKVKWEEWQAILDEIEAIPNLSDKIFMWDSVAELLSDEFLKQKRDLIERAISSVYSLPSFLDTVGRLEMIFYTLYKKSIAGVGLKQLLQDFIKVINRNPHSPFLRENYKNILDVAYSTDPTIAKALVNTFDKDVARQNTGTYLNSHLNLIEFQAMLDGKVETQKTEKQLFEENKKYFIKTVEKRLAKLNAFKQPGDTYLPKDLVYQLKIASQYSIYESHYVFSYFIERLNMFYQSTDESVKLIRKSFLELMEVCDLVKMLSIRNAEKIKSLLDILTSEPDSQSVEDGLLKSGIDDETIQMIIHFLKNGKKPEDISDFLEIDIDYIEQLKPKIL